MTVVDRPASAPTYASLYTTTDHALLSTTTYSSDSGRVFATVDTAGLATYTFRDAAGGALETITGYNVVTDDSLNNVTSGCTETANGMSVTVYAGTQTQTTTTTYGVTGSIASNSLAQSVTQPDGYATTYSYDRQGEVVAMTD